MPRSLARILTRAHACVNLPVGNEAGRDKHHRMNTVLWTHLLMGAEVITDDTDKPALYRHADRLDRLSRELGLGSFIAACDTTDLRFEAHGFELPSGVHSTLDMMARHGAWLPVASAITLLTGLTAHLQRNKLTFGLLHEEYHEVLAELTAALAFATAAPPDARFNFSIVT